MMPRIASINPKEHTARRTKLNDELTQYISHNGLNKDHFVFMKETIHPIQVAISRKIYILAKPFTEFTQQVEDAYRACQKGNNRYWNSVNLKFLYPVIFNWSNGKGAPPEGAIAFPNLQLDDYKGHDYNGHRLTNENPFFPHFTSVMQQKVVDNLADETLKQRWLPFYRGSKTLSKRLHMSLTRALARCVVDKDNQPLNATLVDNMAEKMMDIYKPVEVHRFASGGEEFVKHYGDMYKYGGKDSPQSCMDSRNTFALPNDRHPLEFYAYCPKVWGYYISRGTTVLARCLTYEVGGQEYAVRIYYNKHVYEDRMKEELNKHGVVYKPFSGNDWAYQVRDEVFYKASEVLEFSMPQAVFDGVAACPFPYFDTLPRRYIIGKYNKETQEFDFVLFNNLKRDIHSDERLCNKYLIKTSSTNSGYKYRRSAFTPDISSTRGVYTYGRGNQEVQCVNCGDVYDEPEELMRTADGQLYCGSFCAEEDGQMTWHSSSHMEWINEPEFQRRRDESSKQVIQLYCQGGYVSNLQAAINNSDIYTYVPFSWADTEGDYFISYSEYCARDALYAPDGQELNVQFIGTSLSRPFVFSNKLTSINNFCQLLPYHDNTRGMPKQDTFVRKRLSVPYSIKYVSLDSIGDSVEFDMVSMEGNAIEEFSNKSFDEFFNDILLPGIDVAKTRNNITITNKGEK